jgi:hypothetical protein
MGYDGKAVCDVEHDAGCAGLWGGVGVAEGVRPGVRPAGECALGCADFLMREGGEGVASPGRPVWRDTFLWKRFWAKGGL